MLLKHLKRGSLLVFSPKYSCLFKKLLQLALMAFERKDIRMRYMIVSFLSQFMKMMNLDERLHILLSFI